MTSAGPGSGTLGSAASSLRRPDVADADRGLGVIHSRLEGVASRCSDGHRHDKHADRAKATRITFLVWSGCRDSNAEPLELRCRAGTRITISSRTSIFPL